MKKILLLRLLNTQLFFEKVWPAAGQETRGLLRKIIGDLMRPLMIILTLVLCFSSASATVGGPTYISEFKYNKADESVYYIQQDGGGRGCPNELYKISLETSKVSSQLNCDQGIKMSGQSFDYQLVQNYIYQYIENFKPLAPINLNQNNFTISVQHVSDEFYDDKEKIRSKFNVQVFQNDKKLSEFVTFGCNVGQPFVFNGYSILGFEKKIILLLSAKNNCAEGGYINESLYVVGGVNNLNKNSYLNVWKGLSFPEVTEGTIIAFANKQQTLPDPAVVDTGADVSSGSDVGWFEKMVLFFRNLFQ